MATSHLFETETCGRCGGSGHYSYNQINGTTCFGCGGGKVRLTKRGKAAQAWYHAQQTVPVSEVKVGDTVYMSDMFAGRGWVKVISVDDGVTVEFRKRFSAPDAPKETLRMFASTFRTRPAEKFWRIWQQAVGLAYQATLNKAGKPAKRSK